MKQNESNTKRRVNLELSPVLCEKLKKLRVEGRKVSLEDTASFYLSKGVYTALQGEAEDC